MKQPRPSHLLPFKRAPILPSHLKATCDPVCWNVRFSASVFSDESAARKMSLSGGELATSCCKKLLPQPDDCFFLPKSSLVKEYHSEAVGTSWVVTKVLGDTMTSSTVWHGPCTSAPMEEMNRGQCPPAASPGRLVFPAEEGSS